jgi:hypothetical protein
MLLIDKGASPYGTVRSKLNGELADSSKEWNFFPKSEIRSILWLQQPETMNGRFCIKDEPLIIRPTHRTAGTNSIMREDETRYRPTPGYSV